MKDSFRKINIQYKPARTFFGRQVLKLQEPLMAGNSKNRPCAHGNLISIPDEFPVGKLCTESTGSVFRKITNVPENTFFNFRISIPAQGNVRNKPHLQSCVWQAISVAVMCFVAQQLLPMTAVATASTLPSTRDPWGQGCD